jgi:hypothetical protein
LTKKESKVSQKKFVSKYNPSKYKPSMCDEIIMILARGDGQAAFCAKHNIHRDTLLNWRKAHPEFDEAYKVAIEHCETWWQKVGKEYTTHDFKGTQLNAVAWSMNMRNRFGWTEHRRVEVPGLAEAKTYQDKMDILLREIEEGNLTSSEVTALSGAVSAGMKIAEAAELLERIDKLEAMLEAKKEDETIGQAEVSAD